jgi:glycosyltransferase involved in cell wall biosynthesis
MRVLLVSGSFPPMQCGVGDYTAKLACALGDLDDVTVAVLTRSDVDRNEARGNFEFLPGTAGWRLSETRRIVASAVAWSPDIIHFQYPCQGYGRLQWVLPSVFRILGYPVFLSLHEYYGIRDFRSLASAILQFPNILAAVGIAVTRANYAELVPSLYRWLMGQKEIRHIPIATSIPSVVLDADEMAKVRVRYGTASGRLVSYFGFVSPQKGVESIFEVADPGDIHLALLCDLREDDPYQRMILERTQSPAWEGKVRVTGFLPDGEVGKLLAASDAILLPFRNGVSIGNSSLHAAVAQGTFILTTSREKHGYDPSDNIYYARPGDIVEMKDALREYIGKKISRPRDYTKNIWRDIAASHLQFYSSMHDRGQTVSR